MMNYPLYIFFGLAPSFIWLLFFLRKDSHPEPHATVLKIFFYGMLSAIPVALIELGAADLFKSTYLPSFLVQTLYIFLGVALIEEVFKYLVVRQKVLQHPALDEPVDLILYMIIAALGFAALENLLILFPMTNPFQFLETFLVSSFRFVGATFLHALCSGLIGYFLALSFFESKHRLKLTIQGLILAIVLHGLYDFSIIKIEGSFRFVLPVIILIGLAVFVSWGFKKVKKLKSVCKI